MKKKLLIAVIFGVVICFSISIGMGVAFALVAEPTKVEVASAEYHNNVNRSVELHEQVVSRYIARSTEHNGKKYTIYSDDFAGIFIDDQGFLNIAVVGEPQRTSEYGGQVIYKQFTFSYNYLQKVMNAIENIMDFYNIRTVGIDDFLNLVFVEMRDEKDIAPIIEYLKRESLYASKAIRFEVDPTAKIVVNANTAYGGESLYHWITATTGSLGTICVNAIDNTTGQLGVLTNEHVALAANNTTMFYGGHFNGTSCNASTMIGYTTKGQQGGSIDAAFVPFEYQADWSVTPYARYNTTTYPNVRLGNENQIIRGQPVKRIGQKTGITTGEIRSTNATITVDGGVRITNTFRYTNYGENGDSGGPVYFDDGMNLNLIGMHFASGEVFLGGMQGVACRIQEVMNTLNVTPITNNSFNTTNLSGGGIQLDSVNLNPTDAFVIPSELGGRTVTSIGISAFSNKTNISSIEIPSAVTQIGSNAFSYCDGLTNISFAPNSQLTSIGSAAFSSCYNLTSIAIPNSVTNIGSGAFAGCYNLTNITFDSNSQLTNIGSDAFQDCCSLEIITIPSGVTSIKDFTFYSCNSLKSITILSSVTSIGNYAFRGCCSLTEINGNLVNIGDSAFKDCSGLTNINIPNTTTVIGSSAFSFCTSLTTVTFASNSQLTTIGSSAFWDCRSLTNLIIPSSVSSIGKSAFYNCSSLTSITLPFVGNTLNGTSNTHFGYIFGAADSSDQILIPQSLKTVNITGGSTIDSFAFYRCSNLTNISFNQNGQLNSIGNSAFGKCWGLTSIELPSSLICIGDAAFFECINLSSIIIPYGVTSISQGTFLDCSGLNSISIPNSVTSIGSSAFQNCTWLANITIPSSVTSIGVAFDGCSNLESITLPFVGNTLNGTSNTHFGYIFGAAGYSDQNSYIPTTLSSVIITGANSIKSYSFYGCSNLTNITVPGSVTSIGSNAFNYCSSLLSFSIPSGLTGISTCTFSHCSALTNITIPSSLRYIGDNAFANCIGLTGITFAQTSQLTSIGIGTFTGCINLAGISIPSSVTTIGSGAFVNCRAFVYFSLPSSVTTLGSQAFSNCVNLEYFWFASNSTLTSIATGTFYGCTSLRMITIPTRVTTISAGAFSTCTALTSISFSQNGQLNSIGDYAFENCSSLVSITIPNNVTSIGQFAFRNCNNLKTVVMGNRIATIGQSAFYSCSMLTSLTINTTTPPIIGGNMLYNTHSTLKIYVPSSAVDTYKQANGWSAYSAKIYPIV